MANVAITGVAGFIGSNLADRLLARGHDVVGIDNLAYGIREQVPEGARFLHLDVRDPDLASALKRVDVIFHLAAKNCIADCQIDPAEATSINVYGTANVFDAAAKAGVSRIVYSETSAVYEGCENFPSSEDVTAPRSFYAVSKAAGAALAEAYGRFRGMEVTVLRYFGVYGPRQDYRRSIPPVMSAFIIKMLRGERPTIYGTGEKRRDFVYIDDVNDVHELCLVDARTIGETFNVGHGRAYSVLDIFRQVSDLLGCSIEPIYRPDLEGEAQTTLADIGKIATLGWKPRISLREGLQRSVDYIRAHVL